MDYLADTVTIIRHFSGTGRIGRKAKTILEGIEEGDNHMFLSIVSLVEILSACPSGWKMEPVDSMKWMEETVVKQFPLGVYRDKLEEVLGEHEEWLRTFIPGEAKKAKSFGSSDAPEGATATNPTTGERIITKNGEWVLQE